MTVQVEPAPEAATRRPAIGVAHAVPADGHSRPRSAAPSAVAGLLVGLLAFVVYLRTLAPSIVWGDSPELTAAAFTAGVPHPTGYPLYMILAHAFLCVCPVGSAAYRMNLLSALSGSVAVALVYTLLLRVTRARCASTVAALLFAFGRTFWSQAVIAEHYPFEILCMTAALSCVLNWDRRGERRWLRASAVVYGLCLTHHMMSLLLAPALLYYVATSRHRAQFLGELRWTLPLLLLPLPLYLYLPMAALRDPPLNWGDPRTWDRFVAHVTGAEYHFVMFHLTRAQLLKQLTDYAAYLPAQFSPGFLWLAPLGAWSLARHRPRLFGLSLLVYMVDVVYGLNYFIYNVEIYYLPSHLMVALWIGCALRHAGTGVRLLWRRIALAPLQRPALNRVVGAALLALPLSLMCANWRFNDHHDDWEALDYARAVLATLKPGAVVLGGGDNYYFPLLYAHFVEHLRPDITLLGISQTLFVRDVRLVTRLRSQGLVVRVPPGFVSNRPGASTDSNRLLVQLLADNVRLRPTYVVCAAGDLQLPWFAAAVSPYLQVASTNLPCVELTRRPPPVEATRPLPQHLEHLVFRLPRLQSSVPSDLELLGYDAWPVRQQTVQLLRMTYYWQVNDPAAARQARIWVLFTDADGNYQRYEDGSPGFHNIHPLAYGLGRTAWKLPCKLRETFTLYVPPSECGKRLYMQIGVLVGGRFVPTGDDHASWARLGEIRLARSVGARTGPGAATAGPPSFLPGPLRRSASESERGNAPVRRLAMKAELPDPPTSDTRRGERSTREICQRSD